MASEQVKKLQQQNKQPRAVSKGVTPPSQERSSNPWFFLELIDAPQWVDLTLEGSSMEKEGFNDPWFDRSHKHHVKSLAGLNANMSWLRMGKAGQGAKTIFLTKCQKVPSKLEKKQSAGHQSKSGNTHSRSQGQATNFRVFKGEPDSDSTERGSVKIESSFSGCSSTSANEPSGSFKKQSMNSDRSSVSSTSQVCSAEFKNCSSNVRRGSSDANLSENFHDLPSSHSSGTRRSRNSFSVSYYPPTVSTCTKLCEFGVSTVTKLQFACEPDCVFSGDPFVTSESAASSTSEGQVSTGCARAGEEGTICIQTTCGAKVDGDCNQAATGSRCSTFNSDSLHCWQKANEALKSGIKVGRQKLETQAGSLPRKQLHTGKENAPPEKDLAAVHMLQVKPRPSHTKAPLAFASSGTANARTKIGSSLGGRFHVSQVSKKGGPRCASEVKHWKSVVSQTLNSCHASSTAYQRKRFEVKQLPVHEKAGNSERELAALVAQHNQKIRNLHLQNCRKGFR